MMRLRAILAGAVMLPAAICGCSKPEEVRPMAQTQPTTPSQPAARADAPETGGLQTATFAAGCFWGVEAAFRRVKGVRDAAVGYTGGRLESPTYRAVCTGRTGHAEAVRVWFDPKVVSYEKLLAVFWLCHDPTTLNRQGPDVGSQYRSAIFTQNAAQQAAAEASKAKTQAAGGLPGLIVTEILPAGAFYRAEEYHQRYLEKRGVKTCAAPKQPTRPE